MPVSSHTRRAPRPRLPSGRAAAERAGPSTPTERLTASPRRWSNTAIGRLLAQGRPRIGASTDPAEHRADRAAEAAGHPIGHTGRRGGARPRSTSAPAPGLGGGRPLPGTLMRELAPHYGFDLRSVRLHTDRSADAAARSIDAEGFTYGRDIFLRRDKADVHTRSGKTLLRHELAHVDGERGRAPVIRRKTGLPTAAQATQSGGSSGWGKLGKGEWGTYRGRLDKFRAAADDDVARQKVLLVKLLDSSRKILASGYNDNKKTFVREQLPKIHRLYYEVALASDVYDAVDAEAAGVEDTKHAAIDRGITDRMTRLRKAKQQARWKALPAEEKKTTHSFMIDVDLPAAPTRDDLLGRLQSAHVTMNFPPEVITHFIAAPGVKQFWEMRNDEKTSMHGTDRKGREYAKSRDDTEVMMGYPSLKGADGQYTDTLRGTRPISCGLDVFAEQRGAAPDYGEWFFIFKDQIKARSTYLSGDSIDQVYNNLGFRGSTRPDFIGTHSHPAAVLTGNEDMFDALFMDTVGADALHDRKVNTATVDSRQSATRGRLNQDGYIEVQVHGGISMDDVDTLVVDVPQDATARATDEQRTRGALADRWYAKYRDKGVRVRWG